MREMIPKIVEGNSTGNDALCRVFALMGDEDFYMIFERQQHRECLELLQREIGRSLAVDDVTWVGSLEVGNPNRLILFSGGGSFGKFYENDPSVGRLVQAKIGEMLNQIGSNYILR